MSIAANCVFRCALACTSATSWPALWARAVPQYDVWGDACNVAARMESSARNGTIQVSRAVFETLADFGLDDLFALTQRRRPLSLKGVGTVVAYRLDRAKSYQSARSTVSTDWFSLSPRRRFGSRGVINSEPTSEFRPPA
jgi:class 3 adenylate cyclase